jgi:ABC-2 type transport system ATP-binding protein
MSWLDELDHELHRHGVDPGIARHVVAEAAAHLRDSGQDPMRAFGDPGRYATAVVESVGRSARRGPVKLRASGITKRFGRRTVLDNVDLTVHAGEIVAIVGANGCGKSTLLKICAGLVGADRGEVRVSGTLGYCPQDGGTCDFLLPDDHFVLVGAGRGMTRHAARKAGRAHARTLDWDATVPTQARRLSGGTRQKLNLVMAGLGEPDVLLLDEPYQGFDRGTYLDFWGELLRWRAAGKAIVVVTHLLNQLDRVDTVLELNT